MSDEQILRSLDHYRLANADMIIRCPRCGRELRVTTRQMAEKYGAHETVWRLHWRMHCSACEKKDGIKVCPILIPVLLGPTKPIQGYFGGGYDWS